MDVTIPWKGAVNHGERAALAALQEMRAYFQSGATRSVSVRFDVETLHARMTQMEAELLSALHEDLGKGEAEGYMTEIGLVKSEIRLMQKRLPKLARASSAWARP